MSKLIDPREGVRVLLMGNEAIVRGALEAGVNVAAGYPGTPSSEIVQNLADVAGERNLYVEWSVNEKVAMEVAAAASFAKLRSLCAMKQNGVNVASDFLLHLTAAGTRGGMVLVTCDDPGALSSVNEGESRHFARMVEVPLLEPGDFQEAKDMTKWAFELSEEIRNLVVLRSVTRMSHASGNVTLGRLSDAQPKAEFKYNGFILDPLEGPVVSAPVPYKHTLQQEKLKRVREIFEESPFNTYAGPEKPDLLVVTSSACTLYSREAIDVLGVKDRVGLFKLGTTWPLPPELLKKRLASTDQVLIVEEVIPFLEENVKILAAETAREIGVKTFFGKNDGTLPSIGELNPDLVAVAIAKILGIDHVAMPPEYEKKATLMSFAKAPNRELTFCPGCPHRASFWAIHHALLMDNRLGFVCGDIGCYSMAALPCGFSTLKTLHAMGSGTGVASGFGQLHRFGMEQPAMTVCGDSTFFASVMPALVNAIHHRAELTVVVLDNSGTAMTGFQPHPGLKVNAMGGDVPALDIARICAAMGAKVEVRDPFQIEETRETLIRLLDQKGVKVLIMRQMCALSPEKRAKKNYEVKVDEALCLGETCGCNRLCTRVFRCPALVWDKERKKARVDEVLCAGCGVCALICPAGAIRKEEVA
ncbi:MAG: thiamine pyrophosphate-dependent enzyme [Syntrophales bacterium]|jgi:indolepyruvate ferredoxin oxidoreductase alpha subunit|nr:thiamine pyrophosphate-dependent enzyme [Syntrophales bacterium]